MVNFYFKPPFVVSCYNSPRKPMQWYCGLVHLNKLHQSINQYDHNLINHSHKSEAPKIRREKWGPHAQREERKQTPGDFLKKSIFEIFFNNPVTYLRCYCWVHELNKHVLSAENKRESQGRVWALQPLRSIQPGTLGKLPNLREPQPPTKPVSRCVMRT